MNRDIKLVIDKLNTVEAVYYYEKETIDRAVIMLETLGNKVAQQAAVIEKLRDRLNGCLEMFDPEAGSSHLHRVLTVKDIKEALATPTDSKQVLNDWMREQIGEPAGFITADRLFYFETKRKDVKEVYFKPECLK